ncbi:radical SAM protein [Desulfovibrio aminophilus]|uniref:coproporphyrinogen-III oxidase family protein n=1 Tax=Desulfovibrio aminophilus TaxID=81425 RepID=UPI003393266E
MSPALFQPAEGLRRSPLVSESPDAGRAIRIYVHVPFCRSRCNYCVVPAQRFSPLAFAGYLKTLLAEIELWGRRLARPRVATLYLGGGTPSLFPLSDLARVMDALHAHFRLDDDLEATLEANPDPACDVSFYNALLSIGFTRLSLGVQTLDDPGLALLGRGHSARRALESFDLARQAGFRDINVALLMGVPGQSGEQWLRQLQAVARLRPEHVSCFPLTVEPGTPLARSLELGEFPQPSAEELRGLYLNGGDYLESQGYLQYETAHFARMGFACRHHQSRDRDCLGLGPSARSSLGRRRFANPRYMDAYDAAVRGDFAGLDFEELDDEARLREMVALSLRSSDGLDLERFRKLSGRGLLHDKTPLLISLRRKRLARVRNNHLVLTRAGFLQHESIVADLLDQPPFGGV